MNKYFAVILSSVFVLTLASFAHADFAPADWRYQKDIRIPTISITGLVELNFDEDVFANTASGLRDIRIISDEGTEVAYKLVVERSTVERVSRSGRILDNSFIPGDYSFFVIDLGREGLFHNQIDIKSTSLNFRREVVVEGSNDRTTWAVLNNKAIIYDYTDPAAGLKARNTTARYPESTVRYIRVRIINRDDTPLQITGSSVFLEQKSSARTVLYPVSITEQSLDSDRRASVILLDLGSSGLPNNSLLLSVSDVNFQRDIAIEGSNDRQSWNIVQSRDVIFNLRTPKFTGSKLSVNYRENTYQYLRISIFNQDNSPLTVNGATVSGILRKLIFEADPQQAYTLYYGNSGARYPQYDIERYFQYLETDVLPRATLGLQTLNSDFEEILPPVTERFPWLLSVVLAGGVALLGAILVRLFLGIRKRTPQ